MEEKNKGIKELEEEKKEKEKNQEQEREWRGSSTLPGTEISIEGEREGGAQRRKILSRERERERKKEFLQEKA